MLSAGAVFLTLTVSHASTLSSFLYIRAYSIAEATCSRSEDETIQAMIQGVRSLDGYCRTHFPVSKDCVDKVAFLHYCKRIDKDTKSAGSVGVALMFLFLVFFCLSFRFV